MKVYSTVAELFWDSLPTYQAIGMSSEEFWHGHPRLAESYREAERIRRDNRAWAEWRAGIYAYQALLTASPAFRDFGKGIEHEYPKQPITLASPEERLSEEDKARMRMEENKAAFMAMANKFNAKFAAGGDEEGQA